MRLLHRLHRIEALCVAIATAGAVSGLQGWTWGLDRIGMYADIGAGLLALLKFLQHRKEKG